MPNLIPENMVAITETYHPAGWLVARYDRNGFTSEQRWFPTRQGAEHYARYLSTARVTD